MFHFEENSYGDLGFSISSCISAKTLVMKNTNIINNQCCVHKIDIVFY